MARRKAEKGKALASSSSDGSRLPSGGQLRSLMKQIRSAEADKNESVGRIGSLISNAVERQRVDKKALSMLRALERQSLMKGRTTWEHLLHYVREYGLLEKWGSQERLFEDEPSGDETPANVVEFEQQSAAI
jgi:hypothetical protein